MGVVGVLAAVLCGSVVGALSGILGVGGGSMMVPLFRLGFGMTALAATGTSLFTMIFTSIGGSVSHLRNKTCIVPLALIAGTCGALTAPVGVRLAAASPSWMVMSATAVVIVYSAVTMIRKGLAVPKSALSAPGSTGSPSGASAGSASVNGGSRTLDAVPETPRLGRGQYAMGALAGVAAGVAGGYVGLGGGFLMIPIFISGVGITMRHASGTSLMAVAILSASAAIAQGSLGNVDVAVGLAMAAGSVPAAMLSANLVRRIPERALRLGFGGFLCAVAVFMAVNEILMMG